VHHNADTQWYIILIMRGETKVKNEFKKKTRSNLEPGEVSVWVMRGRDKDFPGELEIDISSHDKKLEKQVLEYIDHLDRTNYEISKRWDVTVWKKGRSDLCIDYSSMEEIEPLLSMIASYKLYIREGYLLEDVKVTDFDTFVKSCRTALDNKEISPVYLELS